MLKRAVLLFALIGAFTTGHGGENLETGFASPPAATRPWCYWYWISDNITRDGITRDLEAMARVGIGEALIGNVVDPDTPLGDVKVLSEKWWTLMAHAVSEGRRVGVNIGVFNAPGWSQSGGPWIDPKESMRYVVSSEIRVTGPARLERKLPVPKAPFQDIAVLAFPEPMADTDRASSRSPGVTTSPACDMPARLADGNPDTVCAFPAGASGKGETFTVTLDFAEPFTARSLSLYPGGGSFSARCELSASDDQGTFRPVREFVMDRRGLSRPQYSVNVGPMLRGPAVVSFAAVRARRFQLRTTIIAVEGRATSDDLRPGLGEVDLSAAARVERVVEKQLGKMHPTPLPDWDSYLWGSQKEPDDSSLAVPPARVLDLTRSLSADGTLRWEIPAGNWIVQRFGMTPTGASNHPTTPEGQGPECDKMNRAVMLKHFDSFVGRLIQRVPEADRGALRHVVIDSYEVGSQNWTDGFDEQFRARYGYDPRPWLPVLSGRIVGSAGESDRFLWDLRRLVADRIAIDYVGGLREVANGRGLRLWLENYGHWGFPAEFLQYGGQTDEVGGEFWVRAAPPSSQPGVELRAASSAAHIYGKRQVFAEGFTSDRSFQDSPGGIKALGDWAFCHGINHLVLHVYIHQPWQDRRPGVNAWFGTEFNRHNTWFEQSRAWIDYLRRCHFLLQQGKSAADVAYFIGEDAPKMTGTRSPGLPSGYDFDYVNAETLLGRARVEGGRLSLPDGPAYRLLVLPPQRTMRPELLSKIRDLVSQGMPVLGEPPLTSPSLEGFPACDRRVESLARELWGAVASTAANSTTERPFGKGRVFRGTDIADVLRRLEADPAISCPPGILWTLRRTEDTDIYFLSNQNDRSMVADVSFRVEGKAPEFWHPDTGATEAAAWFTTWKGRTRVPVLLEPFGSVFVVFRRPAPRPQVVEVLKDGHPPGTTDGALPLRLTFARDGNIVATVAHPGGYTLRFADGTTRDLRVSETPSPVAVTGPWTVQLQDGAIVTLGSLSSWPDAGDDRLRHYSGPATYRKEFQLPAAALPGERRISLELGRVEVIAEVRVNGRDLGVLWKPPFAVDATEALRPGSNLLEIRVTNHWWNRLAGDDRLAQAQRTTFTTAGPRSPRSRLLPAGLLGPVVLRTSIVRN